MNILKVLLILSISILLSGCAIFGTNKRALEQKLTIASDKVDEIEDKLHKNDKDRISVVSTIATGTEHALGKMTNPPIEIQVAKELNERILSIVGNPNLDESKKIKKIVDELTSQVESERKKGLSALAKKDKEIMELQLVRDNLKAQIKLKTEEFNDIALQIAMQGDKSKGIVDDWNKWFGLGAVFYGLKRFITSSLIFLLIGSILFLVIKVFAATNPIFGTILGLFNAAGGMMLYLVKGILPGSFSQVGFLPKEEYNKYKNVLLKIIDITEEMKSHDDVMPDDKDYMFKDYLLKIDKEFGDTDKRVYDDVKKELRWKV